MKNIKVFENGEGDMMIKDGSKLFLMREINGKFVI